jgi:hypothetical protein
VTDIFVSKLNDTGELAGVLEADDDVSYFYLYKTVNDPGARIVGALNLLSGVPDFTTSDVDIRWFENGTKVGLFIRERLWAYFDVALSKGYTGHYPWNALEMPRTNPQ